MGPGDIPRRIHPSQPLVGIGQGVEKSGHLPDMRQYAGDKALRFRGMAVGSVDENVFSAPG